MQLVSITFLKSRNVCIGWIDYSLSPSLEGQLPRGSFLIQVLRFWYLVCNRCSTEPGWEGLMWDQNCSEYDLLKSLLAISLYLFGLPWWLTG